MLKFTKINKENPSKTSAEKRVKSFDEIYANYAKKKQKNKLQDVHNVEFLFARSIALT